MRNVYKYVIANEGVDTAKKYPFYGKVSPFLHVSIGPRLPA